MISMSHYQLIASIVKLLYIDLLNLGNLHKRAVQLGKCSPNELRVDAYRILPYRRSAHSCGALCIPLKDSGFIRHSIKNPQNVSQSIASTRPTLYFVVLLQEEFIGLLDRYSYKFLSLICFLNPKPDPTIPDFVTKAVFSVPIHVRA